MINTLQKDEKKVKMTLEFTTEWLYKKVIFKSLKRSYKI